MHFATLLPSILLLLLPTLVLSSPNPSPNPTPTEPIELDTRGYDEWQHHSKCYGLETRDPKTCKCYPQYEEPHSSHYWKKSPQSPVEEQVEVENKKGGGKHYEECVCPDYPNTELDDGWDYGQWKKRGGKGHEHEHPKCVCKGEHQTYNPHTKKCECDEGYEPWTPPTHYKRKGKGGHDHKLICKPGPTQSAAPGYKKRSPSLHEAIKMREQDERGIENLLGCKSEERACESHGVWKCLDISSSLWSCGGCPGEGIDCGAVPGVSEVTCQQGQCSIESCRRGYTLTATPDLEYLTNTTCVSENGESSTTKAWFVAQGV